MKRRRRERQLLFFGLLLIVLSAITAVALAVYQGRIESPVDEAFVTPAPEFASDVTWPCPPVDEGNGENLPLAADKISVRVLNGTAKQGLAGSTLEILTGRGYVGVGATNWGKTYDGTVRIQFGIDGLRQAYSLSALFPEYEMVLDNRSGAVVDVILGETFEAAKMRPQYAPELSLDNELTAPVQCLPANRVPALPAPRNIPADPLAPSPSASPSPSATPSA